MFSSSSCEDTKINVFVLQSFCEKHVNWPLTYLNDEFFLEILARINLFTDLGRWKLIFLRFSLF